MRIMFRFRAIPFLATVALVALGIALGQWQTRRAVEKETIARRLMQREAAPPLDLNTVRPSVDEAEYRRVIPPPPPQLILRPTSPQPNGA